jgi:hypothetical protein
VRGFELTILNTVHACLNRMDFGVDGKIDLDYATAFNRHFFSYCQGSIVKIWVDPSIATKVLVAAKATYELANNHLLAYQLEHPAESAEILSLRTNAYLNFLEVRVAAGEQLDPAEVHTSLASMSPELTESFSLSRLLTFYANHERWGDVLELLEIHGVKETSTHDLLILMHRKAVRRGNLDTAEAFLQLRMDTNAKASDPEYALAWEEVSHQYYSHLVQYQRDNNYGHKKFERQLQLLLDRVNQAPTDRNITGFISILEDLNLFFQQSSSDEQREVFSNSIVRCLQDNERRQGLISLFHEHREDWCDSNIKILLRLVNQHASHFVDAILNQVSEKPQVYWGILMASYTSNESLKDQIDELAVAHDVPLGNATITALTAYIEMQGDPTILHENIWQQFGEFLSEEEFCRRAVICLGNRGYLADTLFAASKISSSTPKLDSEIANTLYNCVLRYKERTVILNLDSD